MFLKNPMEEDKLINEMRKVLSNHKDLLKHVGANTTHNAKQKLDRERAEFTSIKEQLCEVVDALEVDNWRNAVVRAKSLLNQLEKEALPIWIRTISPHWVGRIAPSSYKRWHSFCREQFLVALGQLQHDVELGLDVNVEEQIEAMKECYLNNLPAIFVEEVSAYITPEGEDDE